MTKQILNISPIFLCSLLLLIATEIGNIYQFANGAQRTIQVSDDLDDVVDDEEDEAWREWGKKKSTNSDFDPPPTDLSRMSPSEIQAEMMKRQLGPVFGFVKLRLGTRRTPVFLALPFKFELLLTLLLFFCWLVLINVLSNDALN